ncbi:hypothetical protein [Streptomyces silvisoli]|uniref:Uncharacterized protein n=1 Tax=Streptomyces silvisoli TaxID=3034235 RepID=A0ABT5ZDW7_9ACTN|nr:hypothetical protein [Streptomyces silvisoli]MDF3288030.1 hypothetical protein [Streptomyces silvisoli]
MQLSHAQWVSDEAHIAFAREHRQDMVNRIDQAIPGIERPGLSRYRLLRSVVPDGAPDRGESITLLYVATQTAEHARRWADATADSLRNAPPAGIGAAHLLASTDGKRALLYAPNTQGGDWHRSLAVPLDSAVHVPPPQHYRLLGSVRGRRSEARR